MTTPSGARFGRPSMGYVAKLGLPCSPSVITGEPVASNSSMVSRTARSTTARYASGRIRPAANSWAAFISSGGRGVLPMGSVGIDMADPPITSDVSGCVLDEIRGPTDNNQRYFLDRSVYLIIAA